MRGYVEHMFSCCYVFILHVMMDSDNKTQNCTFQFVKMVKVVDMSIVQDEFEQTYHF